MIGISSMKVSVVLLVVLVVVGLNDGLLVGCFVRCSTGVLSIVSVPKTIIPVVVLIAGDATIGLSA